MLIYFGQELQKRVLASFHFALNVPGFLLLGKSENIIEAAELFSMIDSDHRIAARKDVKNPFRLAPARGGVPAMSPMLEPPRTPTSSELVRKMETFLLDEYAPPGVIVNERMEILHFRGRTGPYLEPAPGQPQHHLLKMAREGLFAELRLAITQAKIDKATVRRTGVRIEHGGGSTTCTIVAVPIAFTPESREAIFAVLFEADKPTEPAEHGEPPATDRPAAPVDDARGRTLEAELASTKGYLQSIIDEHQRTNDELGAANEELVSSNEELQSVNEELETAKEELQSTNEELTTLNEELQTRNTELDSVNSDLTNILATFEVPIVIVDGARRIRRFTQKARQIFNSIASDTGRLIDDIKPKIAVEDLDQQIAEVIDHVEMKESEVQDRDGHWYRLQIRPYVTVDKKIDGAIVSLIDIDALKRALGAAEWARDAALATVEAVQTPLIVLDDQLRTISANDAFCEGFQATKTSLAGRQLFDLMGGVWDLPDLRSALDRVVKTHEPVHRLLLVRDVSPLGLRSIAASARSLAVPGGTLVLLALDDITERTRGEQERARLLAEAEAATARADEANRAKDLFLATLSHELRTPLSTLLLQAQLMRTVKMDERRLLRAADAIERATLAQTQLIDDLLDISRIVAGKLRMDLQAVELASVVQAAVETVRPLAERKQLAIDVHTGSLPPVSADPDRLQQVVLNLLTNAIKFTPSAGRIGVSLDAIDGRARLRVTDTGVGIEPAFVPHLFDRFTQEDRTQTRAHGGLGLGLAIVRYLVEAHGGTITAESAGKDQGATFTILLPLAESRPAPAPREQTTPAAHRGLAGLRVLLVEDDPGTREAMTEMLELGGARVVAAASAAQAMSEFEGLRPELLVCDIAMPGEDGYSLLRRIRALGADRGGDVPAVALTALASEDDRRHALDAGFQVHMAKPVDFARLVATLVRLLPMN